MRLWPTLLCLALCVAGGSWAQSVTVASSGGDFTDVTDAINSVLSNPAAPDVVTITEVGPWIETTGIPIIANSAEDTNFTLRGASPNNRPILVVGPTAGQPSSTLNNRGIAISISDYVPAGDEANWTVTLENLIIIPAVGSPPGRAIYSNTNATGLSANALQSINVSNVCVTANDGANQPLTTTGLALEDTTGATLFSDDGLFLAGRQGAVVLDHVVSTHLAGANPDGLVYFPDDAQTDGSTLTIGPGCVFSFTDRIGIQIASDGSNVTINGTKAEPVIITGTGSAFGGGNTGNGGLAIFHDDSVPGGVPNPASQYTVNHLHIYNNNHAGVTLAFVDDADSAPTATWNNCLIVNNGLLATAANRDGMNLGDDIDLPWTFNDCTIAGNANAIVDISLGTGTTTGAITFNDCILGGTSGPVVSPPSSETEAFRVGAGVASTITFNNCGLVTSGPAASNGIVDESGGSATITQNAVINDDPDFQSLLSDGTPDQFDVSAAAYAAAGTGGSPLAGGADFVHTLAATSLTITVDGDPTDWTGAAGGDGTLVFDAATNQLIYNDPTGDDLGDGDYTPPTDAAFNDTESDIEEVRIAHDGTNLFFLVRTGAYGTGFGASFETAMTQVAINTSDSNGPSANDFGGFSDTRMATGLQWEALFGLGETSSGVSAFRNGDFGNTITVAGAQDETNAAVEFSVSLGDIGNPGNREINVVVGQGHSAGGAFREVVSGAAEQYRGGGGSPVSAVNGLISRVYDLAGPGVSQSGQQGEIQNAVISGSEIPLILTGLAVTSVEGFELYQ